MKLLFASAAAAAGLFATTAAADHQGPGLQAGARPLPDFPAYAQPGQCYARVPAGAPPQAGGGQRVWTIQRGTGPGAVWRFDQRPVTGTTGAAGSLAGPLDWAPVDCRTGAPLPLMAEAPPQAPPAAPADTYAQASPPPMMAPPLMAPPPMAPPAPGPFPRGGPQHGGMNPAPPPQAFPYPPMPHAPQPHHGVPPLAGMLRFHPSFAGPPPSPFPPATQAFRPAPARFFGDRFLTWSGKR